VGSDLCFRDMLLSVQAKKQSMETDS
jgi:hypothetical protein